MTTKLTAGVLLLAALAVGSVAAGCGSSKSKTAQPRVLRFLSVDESVSGTQRHSPRVGDGIIFTTGLYNRGAQLGRQDGARVGSGEAVCTVVVPGDKSAVFCNGVLVLPDGYLLITDRAQFSASTTPGRIVPGAVIGGVGAYANARGTNELTYDVRPRKPNGVETNGIVVRLIP